MANEPNDIEEAAADFKPRIQGPLRRNAWLLIVIAAVLVVGPALSRVLESYRAIIMQVDGERIYVAYVEMSPEWIDGMDAAQPGDIIEKHRGSWSVEKVPEEPGDRVLLERYERWIAEYEGDVIEVPPPPAMSVIVELDSGEQRGVKIGGVPELATLRKGDRVKKEKYSWGPVIVSHAGEKKAGVGEKSAGEEETQEVSKEKRKGPPSKATP